MIKNKFYRHSSDTMLLPAELNMFLGGLLLALIGSYGLIVEIMKL